MVGSKSRCLFLSIIAKVTHMFTFLNLNEMCTNQRWVRNRYTGEEVFVKCGKCDACLQEKATYRANRIRLNENKGNIALFVTLTYTNECIPYIDKRHPFDEQGKLILRRDVRLKHSRKEFCPFEYGNFRLPLDLETDYSETDFTKLPELNGKPNCVGICYYEDFKNFNKRLRINLQRDFNVTNFTFYGCSEYGSKSKRPHFHALYFINPKDEEAFRHTIVKSWSFANPLRTAKYIELARNASSYIASYVNKSVDIPTFLQKRGVRQKHSFSLGFGTSHDVFSLPKILEKVDTCTLSYVVGKSGKHPTLQVLPIPRYIINRYFPKFVGFSRMSTREIHQFLLDPYRFGFEYFENDKVFEKPRCGFDRLTDLGYNKVMKQGNRIIDKLYVTSVRLDNAYKRYHEITHKSRYDFVIDYVRTWKSYESTCMRLLHANKQKIDYYQFYINLPFDNSVSYDNGTLPYSLKDFDKSKFVTNPNLFTETQQKTKSLQVVAEKIARQRLLINAAMVAMQHNV